MDGLRYLLLVGRVNHAVLKYLMFTTVLLTREYFFFIYYYFKSQVNFFWTQSCRITLEMVWNLKHLNITTLLCLRTETEIQTLSWVHFWSGTLQYPHPVGFLFPAGNTCSHLYQPVISHPLSPCPLVNQAPL